MEFWLSDCLKGIIWYDVKFLHLILALDVTMHGIVIYAWVTPGMYLVRKSIICDWFKLL